MESYQFDIRFFFKNRQSESEAEGDSDDFDFTRIAKQPLLKVKRYRDKGKCELLKQIQVGFNQCLLLTFELVCLRLYDHDFIPSLTSYLAKVKDNTYLAPGKEKSGRRYSSPIRIPKKLLVKQKIQIKVFTDLTVQHMNLYKRWRVADMFTAMFAAIGLILSCIEYEVGFSYNYVDRSNLDDFRNTLRSTVTCVVIISVLTLLYRYWFKIKWRNLPIPKQLQSQVYNNDFTNLMRQNRKKRFISMNLLFDVVVLVVHPLPFWEHVIVVTEYFKETNVPQEAVFLTSDFVLGRFMTLKCSVHVSKMLPDHKKHIQSHRVF